MAVPVSVRKLVARILSLRLTPTIARPICIISTGGLGDFILSIPYIKATIAKYSSCNVSIIYPAAFTELAAQELPHACLLPLNYCGGPRPPFRELVAAIIDSRKVLAGIEFRTLICLKVLPNDWERWLIRYLCPNNSWGCVDRFGYYRQQNILATLPSPFVHYVDDSDLNVLDTRSHIQRLWHSLLQKSLNISASAVLAHPTFSNQVCCSDSTIVFCPYGGNRIRDYPMNQWLDVFLNFPKSAPARIRIVVSAVDSERANVFADALRQHSDLSVTVHDNLTILEVIKEISQCDFLLGVESAPVHIAAALKKHFVCILGGGHFGLFAPYKGLSGQKWVFNRMECFHCNWKCKFDNSLCITQISPDRVLNGITEVLCAKTTDI